MTDPIERAFLALQLGYLASMPARLEELRADIARLRAGQPDAADSLRVRLHRLAGSGGSYGFRDLSSIAREAQDWLARSPAAREAGELELMVDRMATAVEEAGKRGSG